MMRSGVETRLKRANLASLFAAVTAALSLVAVPLPLSPVPVTGQTFGVMLAGLTLGPWWAAVSMLVYLVMGAIGFPVFAGGAAGLGTLSGPTGGYLVGFVAGAWMTGVAAEGLARRVDRAAGRESKGYGSAPARMDTPRRWGVFAIHCGAALLGGVIAVHTVGALWLAVWTGMPPGEAFMLGSAPFIPGDLLKAFAAALAAGKIRTALRAHRTGHAGARSALDEAMEPGRR